MPKYRRDVPEVEAMKYTGENWKEVVAWVEGFLGADQLIRRADANNNLLIYSIEGSIEIEPGNYAAVDFRGFGDDSNLRISSLKSEWFEKSYIPVTVMPKGSDNYDSEKHPFEDMYSLKKSGEYKELNEKYDYSGSERGVTL